MKCKKSTVAIILLIIIVIFNITNNSSDSMSGEERTQKYLEETYNEKFDKITFVESVKNPDTDLSLDGSSFGTIKGKGYTESYLVHSDKENMDFEISYDTHTKKYSDNYKFSLNLRESVCELYEKVRSVFDDYSEKITFSYDIHDESIIPMTVTDKQDLYDQLSRANDGEPYTCIYMYVNMDSFEFCKNEYDRINDIDNYLRELERSTELYSHIGFCIYTLDRVMLEFDRLDTVRIYDGFSKGKAWGESIEEFIQRDSY